MTRKICRAISLSVITCIAMMALLSCGKDKPKLDMAVEQILITDPADGSMEIIQGESGRIRYSTVPEEAVNTAIIEWSIDNEEIASVKNGRVTGYTPGKAIVTASCGEVSANVNVTVIQVPVTSFDVPSAIKVYVNTPVLVNVEVEPSNANASSLEWSVSDPEMATITFKEGAAYVNALKTGSFKVIVTSESAGTKEISCTAYEERMWLYYLSGSSKVKIQNGETLKSNVLPSDAKGRNYVRMELMPQDNINGKVEVSSDNENVFSCTAEYPASAKNMMNICLASGTDFGTAKITVKYTESEQTFMKEFSVTKEASTFPSSAVICYQGTSQAAAKEEDVLLGYTRKYDVRSSASSSASLRAKWSSSNEEIATVVPSGEYSSVAEVKVNTSGNYGKVTITAKDEKGNNSRSIALNVTKPTFNSSTYIVDVSTCVRVVNDKWFFIDLQNHVVGQNEVQIRISDDRLKAKWTSSNTGLWKPSSEYTNSIKVTPKTYGVTTITATDESGQNSLSFKLTVSPDLSKYELKSRNNTSIQYTGPGDYSNTFKISNKKNSGTLDPADIQGLTLTVTPTRNATKLKNNVSFTKVSSNDWPLKLTWEKYTGTCEIIVADGKGNKLKMTNSVYLDLHNSRWKLYEKYNDRSKSPISMYSETTEFKSYDSVLKGIVGASSSGYKFAFFDETNGNEEYAVYDMAVQTTITAEGANVTKQINELRDLGEQIFLMFNKYPSSDVTVKMMSAGLVANFRLKNPYK